MIYRQKVEIFRWRKIHVFSQTENKRHLLNSCRILIRRRRLIKEDKFAFSDDSNMRRTKTTTTTDGRSSPLTAHRSKKHRVWPVTVIRSYITCGCRCLFFPYLICTARGNAYYTKRASRNFSAYNCSAEGAKGEHKSPRLLRNTCLHMRIPSAMYTPAAILHARVHIN